MNDKHQQPDVVIVGGGLAGLTLSLQLIQTHPELSITVLERRTHPLPKAIAKVGESTVEIGAHYLDHVLAQREHLAAEQLPKFGLRCFFGEAGNDLASADELGVSEVLSVPTYQIDRGLLENHLAEQAQSLGVEFIDGVRVKSVDVSTGEAHQVVWTDGVNTRGLKSRWLVDAAGRSGPIKTRLNLNEQSHHHGNAVWFRVDGQIDIDQWSQQPEWHDRISGAKRRLSTNHLMGPGYWVWLIPLSSGATSVGIVSDPNTHDIAAMASYEKALEWLHRHQPRCAQALAGMKVLDFRVLRNYSYSCKQVFSAERWCLTGEAGVFLDPFYSPGTDFIAIGNTYITDLISRDVLGESINFRAAIYDRLYFSIFKSTLEIYSGLYPGFGDRHLMNVKMAWDYGFYWGVLAQIFFSDGLTDIQFFSKVNSELDRVREVNSDMQSLFREHASDSKRHRPRGQFVDQRRIHLLRRFNHELTEPVSGEALAERLRSNVKDLDIMADKLRLLLSEPAGEADAVELALLGDLRKRLAA